MSEWQPIEGYANQYEISRHGMVRHRGGETIGQWANGAGYMMVRLAVPRAQFRVHRLVAEAFVPNPKGLPVVNHLNHNRANNVASNLEWCTQKHNLHHAASAGRMQRDHWRGKRSPNATLTDETVIRIREMYATGDYSWEEIGALLLVSKRTVGRVINKESYVNV